MREDYDKIINNINALLVNTSISDLPHEQQPGPSVLVTAIVVATVKPVVVIAPAQFEKEHWTMMVRLYKYFSFTRETKKHINLQKTVYRPARVIELVFLLKMKQHVIITVSDTREEKFEE